MTCRSLVTRRTREPRAAWPGTRPLRTARSVAAIALALGLGWTCVGRAVAADAPAIEYNRDIRPILADQCFACHGPDSAARKADLRLDRREAAVDMGAITPGKPGESTLIERIFTSEPSEVMPPPKTKKVLTPEQKDLLKRWVESGAVYQPHWSLIPPTQPAHRRSRTRSWVRNPLDRFVLAALEAKGLTPAPEADRRTLARRLALDLTGLPPDPAAVEAFVNDKSADAYEKLVDRFMASERWGEHRGRYWLDAARFADTHGIHFDNYREIWAYRDWVVNAFNRNLSFDRFTIEQLAGDLLPNRTIDQQVASGFNRCNITTNEGGVIPEEYAVLYTRDRTETVGTIWMGLTVNCTVCHDHKFDPMSQREFYEMAAFFNNTTQNPMDGNIKDTPPTILVPSTSDRPRYEALVKEIADVKTKFETRRQAARTDFDKWIASLNPGVVSDTVPSDGLKLLAPLSEGTGTSTGIVTGGGWRLVPAGARATWTAGRVAEKALEFTGARVEIPEAGDFDTNQAFSYAAWIQMPKKPRNAGAAALARMDEASNHRGWDLWIEDAKPAAHFINSWPNDALKVVARDPLPLGQWAHVLVTYDGSAKASGVRIYINGREQPLTVATDQLKGTIRTTTPFRLAQRSGNTARLGGVALQDVRIYGKALTAAEAGRLTQASRVLYLATKPKASRTAEETTEVFDWYLTARDTEFQSLASRLSGLEGELAAIKARGTIAHVMQERPEMPEAFVLFRGEYDKRRDPVKPDTPDLLPPYPSDLPRNRLGFAQWLLKPEQPLTARVTVNRFWQEVFGTGIVRTANDFGVSGELPINQELLDWLAVDFRANGWDIKRLFRQMVTSAAYRQSAAVTPEKLEKDPQNRLLSRGPRFRMDAEMVRDFALSASGLLSKKIGGPSVKPYQPEGVWEAVAMIGSNTRDYKPDAGESLYRRSMYTFWKRSAPPASMEIFNAPSRETCTVRRERTNTPLQALVTLNDPQFVEAARKMAESALSAGGSTVGDRLDFVTDRILSRPLRPEERKVAEASLADLLAYYQAHPADARSLVAVGESKADPKIDVPTLAAWTMLSNELFNLDEALNK
ncbi:MAG: DUF1553 domain-containing protein [Isosphaeraceae bacterium]